MTSPQRPGDATPRPLDEEDARCAGFDAAVSQHRDELFAFMRRRLGDRETAADLTQETFSRMMTYRDAPQIEDHRSMLYRIAHNLIFEYHRSRHRHHATQHVSLDDAGPISLDQPPVEDTANDRQVLQVLERTIAGLPRKCRIAFVLTRFDGLTQPQVAEKMGISLRMVEKHIQRALHACREAVGDRDF
ncbi:RNA polymerase sigma factor [Pseudothauera nasutitermitis]|uniref:RNA polymerase sigma factor n=1 Tax=Pseudothauera nasutitermitis TaxID=2565930 RepID=A0A4S4AXP4_9RHOO|nr:RNA polymerase sigma factor [Pseudothauera nasutitermitis]THF64872.1 RNA polymerase sigma factor [Pseudothauera nasutitermitis]